MADARRRVKVYVLNDERQWDDRGTGHVTSCIIERFQGMSLLVRSETDGTVLLESKIHPDTAYQKQQDSLIVWTENESFELALSFQEKIGCEEIWEIICQVQGRDPSVEITQLKGAQIPQGAHHGLMEEVGEEERLEDLPDAASPIHLPPCDLSRLDEISELFVQALASPIKREKLTLAIEGENYIPKLVDLFRICEDLENKDGLHHLYEIMKSVILLNKNSLLEIMFSDDIIYDIIGCLEYDPSVPTRHRHREYLNSKANFREVIPIDNLELLNKIHQTYRVQYIQDVILPTPSVFEENILSTLASFICFNKVEIVRMVQEDDMFLQELFAQLMDETTEDSRRRDLVLFLKEFCNFAQVLQNRENFFRMLSSLGVLPTLEVILQTIEDADVRQASIDIFACIVEFSPTMVREFIMQELTTQDDDVLLINVLIEQMICDTDPDLGVAMQLMNIIRLLLDPENMNMGALGLGTLPKAEDKYMRTDENEFLKTTEKTKFLSFFYKHCMHVLTAPLLANTSDDRPSKDDFQTSQLLGLILELLTFTVEYHSYHIKNYIINKDLLRRVLILLKSRHQFLVLSVVRFFRKIISMKDDEIYNRYIIRGDLIEPIIRTFKNNGNKYNLLNSALIELFEYIRAENIKSLIRHVVEKHGQFLDGVDYVGTFIGIKAKHDENMNRSNSKSGVESLRHPILPNPSRYRRDARALEEEEEMWFEQEDECEDVLVTNLHTTNELDSIIDSRKATELPGPLLLRSPLSAATGTTVAIIPTIAGTSTTLSTASTIASNGRPRLQNPQVNKIFTASVRTSSSPERPSSPPIGAGTSPGSKKAAVVVVTKENKTSHHAKAATSPTSSSEIKANSVVAKEGIVGLVDYDEDSDDDEEDEDDLPPTKRARITS